jgi:hypothetical protein
VLEKPNAPASTASPSRRAICAVSSAVADRSIEASPMTKWRNGVSGARKARFSEGLRFSAASRYSGKVSQSQVMPAFSTSNGIASTFTRSRMAISRVSGLQGAMPTPQLPMTTEVTPCQDDGVTAPSQQICAS